MALDSTPAALDALRAAWRRMGPAGRVRTAVEMSEAVRRFSCAGELARHPNTPPEELHRSLLERLYGVSFGPADRP